MSRRIVQVFTQRRNPYASSHYIKTDRPGHGVGAGSGGIGHLIYRGREAPLIALDPPADITDVYAFRSWEDPDKVVFILNVLPGQEPSAGVPSKRASPGYCLSAVSAWNAIPAENRPSGSGGFGSTSEAVRRSDSFESDLKVKTHP